MSIQSALVRILPTVFILLGSNLALAAGPSGSGGGDLCENRFSIVRDDIANWILKGGPAGLKLPDGLTAAAYSEAMLLEMRSAKIRCVGEGDKGYPVMVGNSPKVCRFDKLADGEFITCSLDKFASISEADQYVMVHHEYAGLAGVENPFGEASTYNTSNQLSAFLADQIVKKLVIKAVEQPSGPNLEWNFTTGYKSRTVLSQTASAKGKSVEYYYPTVKDVQGNSFYLFNGTLGYNPTFDAYCMVASRQNGEPLMKSSSVVRMNGWTSIGIRQTQLGDALQLSLEKMGSPDGRTVQVQSIICRTVLP